MIILIVFSFNIREIFDSCGNCIISSVFSKVFLAYISGIVLSVILRSNLNGFVSCLLSNLSFYFYLSIGD